MQMKLNLQWAKKFSVKITYTSSRLFFCLMYLICIGHNFKLAPPGAVFSHFESSRWKNFDGYRRRKPPSTFAKSFVLIAEQNEAASEPRSFVLHPHFAIQTVLCSGQSVTNRKLHYGTGLLWIFLTVMMVEYFRGPRNSSTTMVHYGKC